MATEVATFQVGVGARRTPRAMAQPAARDEVRWLTRGELVAAGFVLLALVFHVWTGLAVAQARYALSRAGDLGQRLDRQRQVLEFELDSLTATTSLEAEADRRQLGLLQAGSGQLVYLK
jgi:hypothetical protein